MTSDETIWELEQKLKQAREKLELVKKYDQSEFHCTTAEHYGYCNGIKRCIDWIKEMS